VEQQPVIGIRSAAQYNLDVIMHVALQQQAHITYKAQFGLRRI
jgi:hypothetical protein